MRVSRKASVAWHRVTRGSDNLFLCQLFAQRVFGLERIGLIGRDCACAQVEHCYV